MLSSLLTRLRPAVLVLPLCLTGVVAQAANPLPEKLQGMAISGRAVDQVADRIDPTQRLGACAAESNGDELRVTLTNVRNGDGNIRISLYSGVKDEWMARGMKLIRFDVPAEEGEMQICLPLPYAPGNYAFGLYHDEDADTDYGIGSEGYGFSNNAKAGWFGPASFKKTVFEVVEGRNDMEVKIRY